MAPAEGAYAASLIGAKYNIPCHWIPSVKDAADPDGMREFVKKYPLAKFLMEKHKEFAQELKKYPEQVIRENPFRCRAFSRREIELYEALLQRPYSL